MLTLTNVRKFSNQCLAMLMDRFGDHLPSDVVLQDGQVTRCEIKYPG
jgi:hypothetical protein